MNENIDLTKILKDCPKGFELYSPLFGNVKLNSIFDCHIDVVDNTGTGAYFNKLGQYISTYEVLNECVLFPSKDQRDWSKFTAPWYNNEESIKPKFKVGDRIRHKETNKDDVYEISKVYDDSYVGFNWRIYIKYQDQYELVPNKFDPRTLKPFDKVLVRDTADDKWICEHFSYMIHDNNEWACMATIKYFCCIPYNDETKHLVGTSDEASEFYRYWED